MVGKHLRIRFDKMDGLTKICNRIRYLEIFGYALRYEIYKRIRSRESE